MKRILKKGNICALVMVMDSRDNGDHRINRDATHRGPSG